jgi:hypothetical protein
MIKTIGNTPAVCLKRIVPPDAAEVWDHGPVTWVKKFGIDIVADEIEK